MREEKNKNTIQKNGEYSREEAVSDDHYGYDAFTQSDAVADKIADDEEYIDEL